MAFRQVHQAHWFVLKEDRPRYRLYRFRCDRREDLGQDRRRVEQEEFHNVQQMTERQIMTELIKYKREDLKKISAVAEGCNPTALSKMEPFEQSLTLAASMRELDALITPQMMDDVMVLMNSPLGFMTDRVPPRDAPYELPIVKQCFIEATLRGARTVGNEWNVISSKAYLTRNYFERALKELPELKKLIITPGVPFMKEGGAIVKMKATWTYQGHLGAMERDIPVKVNNGMGTDAILGKADRKFRAAILRQLTGTDWGTEEDDAPAEGVIETTAVRTDAKPVDPAPSPAAKPAPLEPDVASETPLDAVLREINQARTQEQLKAIYDRAAEAAQKGEIDSDQWGKITTAKRKRAAAIGSKS